jgi:hypothetical protein
MNHLSEEQLVLHYYGDAEDEGPIGSHLAVCESCRIAYRELQQALAQVSTLPVPERPEDYGSLLWKRIRPHLGLRARLGWLSAFGLPRWAFATVMGTLLVAAFLVGRYWPRPEPIVVQPSVSKEVANRILLASAAEHLERSQMALAELTHLGGEGEIDISVEQAWARELLESNRIYRQAAERNGEAALAAVLDDLERILLEITHSPSRITSSDLSGMREQIDSDGILFKLRVAGSRMRDRQHAAARELARRSI